MEDFIHLRTHTEYSLLNSTVRIDDLADSCKKHEMYAVGMMDDWSMSGAFVFSTTLTKNRIKPIIGLNIGFLNHDRYTDHEKLPEIGLLCQNSVGYQNLLEILKCSTFKYQRNSYDQRYIHIDDLKEHADGIICLSGGYRGIFNANSDVVAEDMLSIFNDRFYIELTRHGRKNEDELNKLHIDIAYRHSIPLVATNEVLFTSKNNYESYDILSCIKQGTTIYDRSRNVVNDEYYFKSPQEMKELFSDIPEAIKTTADIAKRCNFYLDYSKPQIPSFSKSEDFCDKKELRTLVLSSFDKQLQSTEINKSDHDLYKNRMEFELSIIETMGFSGYMLIVWDFIKWAKDHDIPVGPGRGSGAGSLVSWLLNITTVDPIKYGLFFERFLNPERISLPDFDIDFCQDKRDLVIDYVVDRYGKENVASIITFGKLQAKAALKDVGRAMSIPYGAVDEICKMIPFNAVQQVTLQKAIDIDPKLRQEISENPEIEKMVEIALDLEGLNRHTSTHAAGIVISDKKMSQIVPVYKDENSNLQVAGFNFKELESVGLVKFDFLGLKTLTLIKNACRSIKKRLGEVVNIDTIKLDDQKTFELLRSMKTKGVFQLEAVIPREALNKCKADRLEDIIAITSLNRPGPMDNIPSYIKRKLGTEHIQYISESLKDALGETYGIIIYQEQVLKVAQIIAGYTPGAADILRRAMGKKIKEEMDAQRNIFIQGALKVGIVNEKGANEIFNILEKFAGYGFNKAHATCYSVISYQTAYLKANYPTDFFVSVFNLEIHNTDKLNEFINDAKRFDVSVLPPDINKSNAYFDAVSDNVISYGIIGLKSLGEKATHKIIEVRNDKPFIDIFDFCQRVGHSVASKKQLENLISSGCFDSLHSNRKQLFESVDIFIKYASSSENFEDGANLFDFDSIDCKPKMKDVDSDYSSEEKMNKEFEAIGFYLSNHPFDDLMDSLEKCKILTSANIQLLTVNDETDQRMVGVITNVKQRLNKNGRFCFVHLSDLDGMYEVFAFSKVLEEGRDLIAEGKVVGMDVSISISNESGGGRITLRKIYEINDFISKYKNNPKSKSTRIQKNTEEISMHPKMINIITSESISSISETNNIIIKINDHTNLEELKDYISKYQSLEGDKLYISWNGLAFNIRGRYDSSIIEYLDKNKI